MPNQFVKQIRLGASLEIRYSEYGVPDSINIANGNSSTCIPAGNDHFKPLIEFVDSNSIRPVPDIRWVQIVRDSDGNVLHYRCNIGSFIDSDNPITNQIKQGIKAGKIEVQEDEHQIPFVELQVTIFLPRAYSINDIGLRPISHFDFNAADLGLAFPGQVSLLQQIESDYFNAQEHLKQYVKNHTGNVIRIRFSRNDMHKVYRWSASHIENDVLANLTKSIEANIALYKRRKSQGPTTSWYLEWLSLQSYLWAPILEIANRLIGLINNQAHRKTASFLSRDDLGDVVCIRAIREDGQHYLWSLSSLKDQQISLFPVEFNWQYKPVERSFHRVRYLMDRGLHFEAIVVTQAILEGIINGMFSPVINHRCFKKDEIKWEQKYRELRHFINERDNQYLKTSSLYSYLETGLQRIYELRNQYAHDIFEKQPSYDFKLSELKEIADLLKPITDTWENMHFMNAVSEMYRLRNEFWGSLLARVAQ